jgi:two-component system sensor histidine kinase/response regulator
MVDQPFKIRLPRSEDRVSDAHGVCGDTRRIIAEFPLTQSSHFSQLSRRCRIFAALVGLGSKHRLGLSRATAEAAKVFHDASVSAFVRFALRAHNENDIAEVQVVASVPEVTRIVTSELLTSERLSKIQDLAATLQCEIIESPPSILLGVSVSPLIPLSEDHLANWAELLQAPSLEDAIVIAQRGRQPPGHEFGIARLHGPSEAAARQAAADRDDLETLSLVANQSPIGILVMDAYGGIQWANPAFGKFTGYAEAEVIGRRFDQLLFGPSTDPKAVRNCEQALRNGHEMTCDLLQYHRNGRTIWVELRLIPIHDEYGKLVRWIGIETDITARHQTEEALRAAKQSAETSNRAKSEFLANMSHEIRTPLNAVVGMTELALTTELSAEQRDYLNCVQSSADTLLGLLNDVLDVSKIEAGKLEIESITFNLVELVRETLRALAVKAHQKGLELAVHMPMDIPQYMEGDPLRIRQVLYNLIGNAIKFTEQGEVVIEVEEQWSTDDEICLHFAVRDTGIGIPKDRLQQIFDSFTQVDSSMARRFGGTGLGLTITSELIRMMEGKIWVQSSLGEGSTFHFTIQLRLANPPDSAPLAIDAEELSGKRALVVDDNATNRRILDEILRHWGIEPTLTDCAGDAMEILQELSLAGETIDLVLLDAMMPRVDGFELAERIKSRPELKCGPVMMLSSADRPNSAARCRQLGIETYLVKPVSASSLLEAIIASLSGNRSKQYVADKTIADGGPIRSAEPLRKLTVLVVDDHEPNRKLAMRILQRRGHDCDSATDGDEAVAAVSQRSYDVVLMDVQMPKSDGFVATKQIRRNERENGSHVPIVALTAHALTGDREKCLAAGMDSYLAKPIHASELIAMVERITSGPSAPPNATDLSTQHNTDAKPFDISEALRRMNGETDLLIEHIGFVIHDAPQLISNMRQAIESSDADSLVIAAHRLKSLVGAYSHDEAHELSYSLELMGKQSNFDNAEATVKHLELLVTQFVKALKAFRSVASRS